MKIRQRLGMWLLGEKKQDRGYTYIVHNPKVKVIKAQSTFSDEIHLKHNEELGKLVLHNIVIELVERCIREKYIKQELVYNERERLSTLEVTMHVVEINAPNSVTH
jgi:hypothetical protein